MSRIEFARLAAERQELDRAQLVEGEICLPPSRVKMHVAQATAALIGWVGNYISRTPGLSFAAHRSVRLDAWNMPAPTVVLLLPKHLGGVATIDADDYVSGPPTLVVEVAASSVSIDLNKKREAYRRNGVREYLVWRTEDAAVDWFYLNEGRFDARAPDANGVVVSGIFAGLSLNVPALLRGDLAGVLDALADACAGDAHAAFVQSLKASA